MHYKLRRAAKIYREQGATVVAKKALRYAPVEVNNTFYRLRQESPTKVMDEDWDTLIILDACRYDMFEEVNHLDGSLEHRISLGSTSEEFLERNFTDEKHHDTVYVNANPYVPYLGLDEGTFHAVVDLLSEWDDEVQTVQPKTVADAASEAHREYPNKRLIVHFMQPHAPFIGETGRQLGADGWNPDWEDSTFNGVSIWQQLRNQSNQVELELDCIWKAYKENLELVLGQVETLLTKLDGRIVITSDHGNLVGERLTPIPTKRKFGHPLGVYHPNLVKVPWLWVETERRREIKAEPPEENSQVEKELTEERLRILGYR